MSSGPSIRRFEGVGRPHVVIAGGGVAGLETLLALRHLAEERVEIELVAPERDFVYKPLATAEPFGLGRVSRFDLAAIAAEHGAEYVPESIVSVDANGRRAATRRGGELSYDALVLAPGARMRAALTGAINFWGAADGKALRGLLGELENGSVREVAFAVPGGPGWPLPVYELALLTARHLADAGIEGVSLTVVTPEAAPLALFGASASENIETLLRKRGITVLAGAHPVALEQGHLTLVPSGRVAADRVVTVPRAVGPRLPGVPHDEEGFVPVDLHARVGGLEDLYAVGDVTAFPIKQGGLAAQQADAAAEALAEWAGAPVSARPFSPVLRGLLLTGGTPRFLRAEITGGKGESSSVTSDALWWPPGKIAGRFLAPYLASFAHTDHDPVAPDLGDGVPVEVDLSGHPSLRRSGSAAQAPLGRPHAV